MPLSKGHFFVYLIKQIHRFIRFAALSALPLAMTARFILALILNRVIYYSARFLEGDVDADEARVH